MNSFEGVEPISGCCQTRSLIVEANNTWLQYAEKQPDGEPLEGLRKHSVRDRRTCLSLAQMCPTCPFRNLQQQSE